MSPIGALPKLAAMFMTEGHRVPAELLSNPALDAPDVPAATPHPLDEWECPLDGVRKFGLSSGSGVLPMRPPEY
jgi:hypothetical protein